MDNFYRFPCPHCGRSIKCLPAQTGRKARCPKCGEAVVPLPKARRAEEPLPLPAPEPAAVVPRLVRATPAGEEGERQAVERSGRDRSADAGPPRARLADGGAGRTPTPAENTPELRDAPLLSLARAIDVGEAVARRYDAKKTLERFARLAPDLVRTARVHFAQGLQPDETPLAFFGHGLGTDGRAGTLVTNRRVYSSLARDPLPLADILLAHVERPSQLQEIMTGVQVVVRTLLVNGNSLIVGSDKFALLAELLTDLGLAVREEHGLTWAPPDGAENDCLPRAAAAWVCDRRSDREIKAALAGAGMPPDDAAELVDSLAAIRYRRQYVLPWVLILIGIPLVLFGALILLVGSDDNMYGRIWGGGFGLIFGFLLPGIGLYRLVSGKTPWRTHELLAAWRRTRTTPRR